MKKIQTPAQAKSEAIHIATMQTQYQHILERLERRIRSAIDLNDFRLVTMLREERETIQKKLLPIPTLEPELKTASSPWDTENSSGLNLELARCLMTIVFVVPYKTIDNTVKTH